MRLRTAWSGIAPAAGRQREEAGVKREGVVSWFNERKGFGFIVDDDGTELFVSYAEIERDGFQTLVEGERVRYEISRASGAPKAVSVTPVVG